MKQLQYLNKYLWKYRRLILVGALFIFVANLFALYPAEFVRKAFDSALLGAQEKVQKVKIEYVILKYGILIVVFAVLKGIFMFFMRQTIIVMSRKIEFDLKNENIDYVIQINGKKRTIINAKTDLVEEKILNIAKNDKLLDKYLNNKSIKKVIFVKNRLLNILINE